jgi:dCMP deaminase
MKVTEPGPPRRIYGFTPWGRPIFEDPTAEPKEPRMIGRHPFQPSQEYPMICGVCNKTMARHTYDESQEPTRPTVDTRPDTGTGDPIPWIRHRPTVDEYYLGIARAVAARAECSRRQVGAVIVRDQSIMSTGFNGAPPGEPSCLDGACPRALSGVAPGTGYASSGCVAVHAEANAIIRAGRERCLGATLYVTSECCDLCAPLVRAAGITRVVTPLG